MFLLANAQQALEILENGLQAQKAVTGAMEALWTNVLNSPLYETLAKLGVFFAVGTIALLVVNLVKELLQDELSYPPYEKLIWLGVVLALLVNQGAFTRDCTLALRGILNGVNQTVLENTLSQGGNLIEAFAQATSQVGLQQWFNQQLQQCQSIPDPEQKKSCIEQALQTANQIASQLSQPEEGGNPLTGIGKAIGSALEAAMQGWLIGFGIAFQWLVEVVWLLMGLLAPLAVGGTLLPVAQKSLLAWLIGFWSVGLCKLCFNVLVGLLSMVQLQAKTGNTLVFSIAVGFLSPVLAVTMAAGGGMATLSSLATLTGMASAKMGAAASAPMLGGLKAGLTAGGRLLGHPIARRAEPLASRVGSFARNQISPRIPTSVRSFTRARVRDAQTPLFRKRR